VLSYDAATAPQYNADHHNVNIVFGDRVAASPIAFLRQCYTLLCVVCVWCNTGERHAKY
jgi:hypothetical protein